ncbi:MAG TPA: macro domain-containing protein [Solirubrobacterales bacterium]|nr:macro domain-containing protein [Solirubrobacterales bacterium]
MQVCPRGCEFRELARRDLLTKTRVSGKAIVHASFTFETKNCPFCGAGLARKCGRCGHEIFAPVEDRCQFCGLPQPWATERRAGAERADLRAWSLEAREEGKAKGYANDPAIPLYESEGRGSLWIIEGDITRLEVDAVVSNDDVDGRMWSQVARAIKTGAGEGVERIAQEGKPFPLGHAWWTTAGGLQQMKGIIHVASMSRRGKADLKVIRKSLLAALELASKQGCSSLGVAAIGSGPTTIEPVAWYRMFGKVMVEYLDERKSSVEGGPPELAVVLTLFEPNDFEAEVERVGRAVRRAWWWAGRPSRGELKWTPPSLWRRVARRLRRS